MPSIFTSSSLLVAVLAFLAFYSTFATAQAGMSIACTNCIQQKLLLGVPECKNVNLTAGAEENTTEYRQCICYSSYDFNWTLPCRDFGACQLTDLAIFRESYTTIFSTLNLTCVKPTPTPNSASRIGGHGFGLEATVAASVVVLTMLAGGVGAFLATVGF
ncbi:hypothetical protein BGZ73_004264 [Actinomortierella ambigua]|nr:hypothetical protein BGZ73_004264 [Actinomortierella ambigua]